MIIASKSSHILPEVSIVQQTLEANTGAPGTPEHFSITPYNGKHVCAMKTLHKYVHSQIKSFRFPIAQCARNYSKHLEVSNKMQTGDIEGANGQPVTSETSARFARRASYSKTASDTYVAC
jgi:hypothetical protein